MTSSGPSLAATLTSSVIWSILGEDEGLGGCRAAHIPRRGEGQGGGAVLVDGWAMSQSTSLEVVDSGHDMGVASSMRPPMSWRWVVNSGSEVAIDELQVSWHGMGSIRGQFGA